MIRPGRKIGLSHNVGSLILGSLLLLVLVIGLGALKAYACSHVPPGVEIASLSVGWNDFETARKKILPKIEQFLDQEILIEWNSNYFRFVPRDFEVNYDLSRTLRLSQQRAMGAGVFDLWSTPQMILAKSDVPLDFTWNKVRVDAWLAEISRKVFRPSRDATLLLEKGRVVVRSALPGREVNRQQLLANLRERLAKLDSTSFSLSTDLLAPKVSEEGAESARRAVADILARSLTLFWEGGERTVAPEEIFSWFAFSAHPVSESYDGSLSRKFELLYELKKNKLAAFLNMLRPQVEVKKQDAVLGIVDGKVAIIKQEVVGRQIDVDKTYQSVKQFLGKSDRIQISFKLDEPAISTKTLPMLGIRELLGVGETEFEGSSWGRATNIRIGAARYQGLLIPPGEVFSFNEHVGSVSPEEGYVKEYVIGRNRVELQYGGGLCQVSTTLFRAAIFSGLPIVERVGHGFAVSWYDWPSGPGMDATIYAPVTDLKIKNDTPGYILMNVYITSNNHLVWELWGTKERTVEVIGPYKVWQGADGSMQTNFTRKVRYNDGREVVEDFPTYYESPAKYGR